MSFLGLFFHFFPILCAHVVRVRLEKTSHCPGKLSHCRQRKLFLPTIPLCNAGSFSSMKIILIKTFPMSIINSYRLESFPQFIIGWKQIPMKHCVGLFTFFRSLFTMLSHRLALQYLQPSHSPSLSLTVQLNMDTGQQHVVNT